MIDAFTKIARMRMFKNILPVVAILGAALSLVIGGLIAGVLEFFLSNYGIYPTENRKIFGSIVIFTSIISIYICYKAVVKIGELLGMFENEPQDE